MRVLFLCASLKNVEKSDLTFVVSETCQNLWFLESTVALFVVCVFFFPQETLNDLLSITAPTDICLNRLA